MSKKNLNLYTKKEYIIVTTNKVKGVACGVVAAITYGMNPLGALNLYAEGINTDTVLFYRYGLAVLILAVLMVLQRQTFTIHKKELLTVVILGVLFAVSSISLFGSFRYMDAGIASTILFVYPIMVAVIMAVFFKEKITAVVVLSILLSLAGIALLYQDESGATLSTVGVMMVMLSSLAYAIYIVIVNKSSISLPPVKMTFFVMIFGTITIAVHSLFDTSNHLQILTTTSMWGWAVMLAVFPTVVSLVLMVVAVKELGSTPTAIMGALEPVTAVVIGIAIFDEVFTLRMAYGILLILLAVVLIITGKLMFDKAYAKVHKMKSAKVFRP